MMSPKMQHYQENRMRARYTLGIAMAALLMLASAGLAAQPLAKQSPKGDEDFRAAWKAFAAPVSDPEKVKSMEVRQEARMAAIPLMEAAVAADPNNWTYQESLGYLCLTAGKYDKAKTVIDRAIRIKGDRPLLYMLRGQAEAALAQMNPPEAGKNIQPAIDAFDRAGRADKLNALPLLQGASVAFDVDRHDLAVAMIKEGLQRPGCMLYTLMVPTDLFEDKGESVRAWQYVQLGHWYGLLARFRNDSRVLLKRGAYYQQKPDLGQADQQYRWALQIGRMIGAMQPNLFINVAAAADIMEDAYRGLAQVAAVSIIREAVKAAGQPESTDYPESARALIRGLFVYTKATPEQAASAYSKWSHLDPPPTSLEDTRWNLELLANFYEWYAAGAGLPRQTAGGDLERWTGEAGVVTFARGQLAAALDVYVKEISKNPPTVQEVLAIEERAVAPVIAGIGLTPHPVFAPSPSAKTGAQAKPARVTRGVPLGQGEAAS
jgi:tetratricopeptide (TPR) repeat protein